jgi:hypothetical protein
MMRKHVAILTRMFPRMFQNSPGQRIGSASMNLNQALAFRFIEKHAMPGKCGIDNIQPRSVIEAAQ